MRDTKPPMIFTLWHSYERPTWSDENKLLGIYFSRALAEEALERVRHKPGFVDYPDGFFIGESPLDSYSWETGFITEYFPFNPELPLN